MISENILKEAIKIREDWFDKDNFSITRDIFTARLESIIISTKNIQKRP